MKATRTAVLGSSLLSKDGNVETRMLLKEGRGAKGLPAGGLPLDASAKGSTAQMLKPGGPGGLF